MGSNICKQYSTNNYYLKYVTDIEKWLKVFIKTTFHPCIKCTSTKYFSPLDPIFFPNFFSMKILFWPQDPLHKGNFFYCTFELSEAFITRIHKKNIKKPSKKAKNTAASTNILPQKAKVLLFFPLPPAPGNLPFMNG